MSPDVRVLESDDDLIHASNVFRTAMIGFCNCRNC